MIFVLTKAFSIHFRSFCMRIVWGTVQNPYCETLYARNFIASIKAGFVMLFTTIKESQVFLSVVFKEKLIKDNRTVNVHILVRPKIY